MDITEYFDCIDGKYTFRVGQGLDDKLAKKLLEEKEVKLDEYRLMLEIIAEFDKNMILKDRELDGKINILYNRIQEIL